MLYIFIYDLLYYYNGCLAVVVSESFLWVSWSTPFYYDVAVYNRVNFTNSQSYQTIVEPVHIINKSIIYVLEY